MRTTDLFNFWMKNLTDRKAKARILARIHRIQVTSTITGDVKSVGGGVSEMRFHFGPGYRVYFTKQGQKLVVLLIGGDKSTQKDDVAKAKKLKESLWSRQKNSLLRITWIVKKTSSNF
ncbi:type II toxin-antitoxin system RelE/ParE family toxin [Parascardovia denticolens]